MRHSFTFFTLLCCFAHSTAEAAVVCNHEFGIVQCASGTQNALDAQGSVFLNGTQIQNTCAVQGYLHAVRSHLHTLRLHGTALLEHTHIDQHATLFGYLSASESDFKKPITLHGQTSTFSHCHLNALNMIAGKKQTPQVWLKDHSEITGNVHFRGKNGIVFLDKTSSVQGNIIGGTKKTI
jgi:hypothetical protein